MNEQTYQKQVAKKGTGKGKAIAVANFAVLMLMWVEAKFLDTVLSTSVLNSLAIITLILFGSSSIYGIRIVGNVLYTSFKQDGLNKLAVLLTAVSLIAYIYFIVDTAKSFLAGI